MHNQIGFGKLAIKSKFFPHLRRFRYLKPNPLQTHLIKFQTLNHKVGSSLKTLKTQHVTIDPWVYIMNDIILELSMIMLILQFRKHFVGD